MYVIKYVWYSYCQVLLAESKRELQNVAYQVASLEEVQNENPYRQN
jgi:hypothetical protein